MAQMGGIIRWLIQAGIALLACLAGIYLYGLRLTTFPVALFLCLLLAAGALHAAGRLRWLVRFTPAAVLLSRFAPRPTPEQAAVLPGVKRARAEALRRKRTEELAAWRRAQRASRNGPAQGGPSADGKTQRAWALEVLGLSEGATPQQVKDGSLAADAECAPG